MNCTIFQPADIGQDGTVTLDEEKSLHLREILGKRPGDSILAGVVNGAMGMAKILDDADGRMRIALPAGEIPAPHPVDLILAMPRPKVMNRLWGPFASIGLRRITIIGAEQVEPFYFESRAVEASNYVPRMIEGLEQARDTRLPEVTIVKSFDWFAGKHLDAHAPEGARIIGQPDARLSVREAVRKFPDARRATIAVGPESGWTGHELETFQHNGFISAGMRDRALRTDTATISLLALIYDALAASYSDTTG